MGWIVYSVFVGVSFVFLKVLNYRLHQALGTDPTISITTPPEEEQPPEDNDATSQDNENPNRDDIVNDSHTSAASSLNDGRIAEETTPTIELSTITHEPEEVCVLITINNIYYNQ